MLPSNLLVTRRFQDRIRPVYAELTPDNLEVAKLLIDTYDSHVGRTRGDLSEAVTEVESLGYDYRFIRGLAILLDRRCLLESRTIINPLKARRTVFKRAHQTGFPTTTETRLAILRQAAKELQATVEAVEASLYGDLQLELLLTEFNPVDPEALVKQYNLSLAQTLLFHSTEITFSTTGNWQRIFRQIKWLGLIYTINSYDGTYEVTVDGPASLFKLSTRYGTNLAKLLPPILQNPTWNLRAKILLRKGARRLLNLELGSDKYGGLMKGLDPRDDSEGYDSQVEEDFANRFKALDTGWTVIREPEPIQVGRGVMIPDFSFQKGRLKVYLEVVGFWTPQYLAEKVKKLNLLTDVDMIVAASRELACEKLDKIGKKLNLIYFKRRIPLNPIVTHLKALERHLITEQRKRLSGAAITLQNPVVEAKELAETLDVLETTAKQILRDREWPEYTRLGDMLIKETKLKEIQDRLEHRLKNGRLSLDQASAIIEAAGGRQPTSVLEALGFKIEWQGIDRRSAKIRRKNPKKSRKKELETV